MGQDAPAGDFGVFNRSVTMASIMGDTLVEMYHPQRETRRSSHVANEIERHTLAWLGGKFGLPAGAGASFTSGGAEAKLSPGRGGVPPGLPGRGGNGVGGFAGGPTGPPKGVGRTPLSEGGAPPGAQVP